MIQPQSTKSIFEEILCLCDYSPPPLFSTVMTYRAPLEGLLTAAAVTYVYWGGAGVIHLLITDFSINFIYALNPSPIVPYSF